MERREQKLRFLSLCFFLSSLLIGKQCVEGSNSHGRHQPAGYNPTKLFVFGDSYADTGNTNKSTSTSWKVPYGITFPGIPSGRFSDGRVLTDFLAKFLGLKSPVPYVQRKFAPHRLQYGMNFAYGGTGVFKTLVSDPNMTVQIDFFQKLISDSVYNKSDLQSSVALVTHAGNDYNTFIVKNGITLDILSFIPLVIDQLAVNLKRIHDMGVKRVAVTAMEPSGCLPRSTQTTSFKQCNNTVNVVSIYHNFLLEAAVTKLNNNKSTNSSFVVLDLFGSFSSALENKENVKFETTLQPCCMGVCGGVDERGGKMYTVCANPKGAFFWDTVHPTQSGWRAVFLALKSSLQKLK